MHAEKEADKGKMFNMQQTFNSIVALFNNTAYQDACSAPDENSLISSTTIENSNLKITTSAIGSKEHLCEEQELVTPMIGKISKDPVGYNSFLQILDYVIILAKVLWYNW